MTDLGSLNVAVVGCCHGELDMIYATLAEKAKRGERTDLLVVCGDFQCVRTYEDFEGCAIPHKYRKLNTFYQYVNGERRAPVLTVFIGGNHEASHILHSVYLGGFVAPNIYFLGFSGSVWFGGLRIAGLSGIFNERHYKLSRFEVPPYSDDTVRSVYHLREIEVFRMAHLANKSLDIFLSHDWPSGIWNHGDVGRLLSKKSFFRDDINSGKLGSKPLMYLLGLLKPRFWFAAHLHVMFQATVHHSNGEGDARDGKDDDHPVDMGGGPDFDEAAPTKQLAMKKAKLYTSTSFLALDKVLPRRDFLQILRVPRQRDDPLELCFDPEWLAIVKRTHSLTVPGPKSVVSIPDLVEPITVQEVEEVERCIRAANDGSLVIPHIGAVAIPPKGAPGKKGQGKRWGQMFCHPVSSASGSPQTDFILAALGLEHNWTVPFVPSADTNESEREESVFLRALSVDTVGSRARPTTIGYEVDPVREAQNERSDQQDRAVVLARSVRPRLILPPPAQSNNQPQPSPWGELSHSHQPPDAQSPMRWVGGYGSNSKDDTSERTAAAVEVAAVGGDYEEDNEMDGFDNEVSHWFVNRRKTILAGKEATGGLPQGTSVSAPVTNQILHDHDSTDIGNAVLVAAVYDPNEINLDDA